MLVNSDFQMTVVEVAAANRLYNGISESPIHRKNRIRWAIALKTTGTTWYEINGKKILSDSTHIALLPKGTTYSWTCTEPGECLIIEFDILEHPVELCSIAMADTGFFVRDFYSIQAALHAGTPEKRLEAFGRMYSILHQLFKSGEKEYVSKEKRQLLQPALDYIAQTYYDPQITNGFLAGRCGISEVYFRKTFVSAYGIAPIKYLHNIRIQKAKDILSSDYASVGQVAQSVGYSSVYHFSKMFKLYTGTSPSAYAKDYRL